MFDHDFYAGPLGGLRALPGTDQPVTTPLTVIGGSHTSLTGTITRDVYGFKRSWVWTYFGLTVAQAQYVEALTRHMIAGPLFLIDPRRPNRLPEHIASGGSLLATPEGFIPSNTAVCYWRSLASLSAVDHTTLPAAALLRGAIEWRLLTAGAAALEPAGRAGDGRLNIPVLPDEPLDYLPWATGPSGATVTATLTVYDRAGNVADTAHSDPVTLSPTEWRALPVPTLTTSADAAYARVRLDTPDGTLAGSIYTTAWSLHRADDPELVPGLTELCETTDPGGGWRLGGGGAEVIPLDPSSAAAYIVPGLTSTALTLSER